MNKISANAPDLNRHNARSDIIQVKNLYGAIIDGIVNEPKDDDVKHIVSVLIEDAVVDLTAGGYGVFRGHEEIAKVYTETMPASTKWMWRSFHNPIIKIDGNRAFGRRTIYALILPKTDSKIPQFIFTAAIKTNSRLQMETGGTRA